MKLAPSILSADFGKLSEQVSLTQAAGAEWVHIDAMDGQFVPNLSFGMCVVNSLRKYTDLFFDAHLMITEPERFIDDFIKAGADGVTFHIEATKQPEKCIEMIKSKGKSAAIAINPDTPLTAIEPYLDKIDMVLIMSVFPGYGGQSYIEDVNPKIEELRARMGEDFLIQVDGGIKASNIAEVVGRGANVIVAGSEVYGGGSEEIEARTKALIEAVK